MVLDIGKDVVKMKQQKFNKGTNFYKELMRKLDQIIPEKYYEIKAAQAKFIEDEKDERIRYRAVISAKEDADIKLINLIKVEFTLKWHFKNFNPEVIIGNKSIIVEVPTGIEEEKSTDNIVIDVVLDDTINFTYEQAKRYLKRSKGAMEIFEAGKRRRKVTKGELEASKIDTIDCKESKVIDEGKE